MMPRWHAAQCGPFGYFVTYRCQAPLASAYFFCPKRICPIWNSASLRHSSWSCVGLFLPKSSSFAVAA